MPLVLAIEPDRRQAAQLTNIVRQRVGADLILAETTEGALESIGTRVPDLVLVPALLSPQDDAALATALRVIATAARVQMLTIPVLATQRQKKPARRGVLSSLLGGKAAPAPDGCDPAVFAEQISEYLARAAEERALDQRRPPIVDTADAHPSPPADEWAGATSHASPEIVREFEEPIADTPVVVINELRPTIEHQNIIINQFAAPVEPAPSEAAYVEPTAYAEPITYAEPAAYAEPTTAYAAPAVYAEPTPTVYADQVPHAETSTYAEPAAYAEPTGYAEPATDTEPTTYGGSSIYAEPTSSTYDAPTYAMPVDESSSSLDRWAPQPHDSDPSAIDAATTIPFAAEPTTDLHEALAPATDEVLPVASLFDEAATATPAWSAVPTAFERIDLDQSLVDPDSLVMEPAADVSYTVPEPQSDFAQAERARISEIFASLSRPEPEDESEPAAVEPTTDSEPEEVSHQTRRLELIDRPPASFDEQPTNEVSLEHPDISPFEQQLAALEQTAFPVIEHISAGDWTFDEDAPGDVGTAEGAEDHDADDIDIDLTADLERTVSAQPPAPVPFAAAVAEFTDAVEALEPAIEDGWEESPREPVEPIALGAWRSWPDIEGTTAERGEDPFAIVDAIGTGAVDAESVPMLETNPELMPSEMPVEAATEEQVDAIAVADAAPDPDATAVAPEAEPSLQAQAPDIAPHPGAFEPGGPAGSVTKPDASSKNEHPEWVDLIESLRRDIQRLRTERTKGGSVAAAAPNSTAPAHADPAKGKRRADKARPLQDEWGFFDPEQCGFAALLDKLDEITDSSEDEKAGTVA